MATASNEYSTMAKLVVTKVLVKQATDLLADLALEISIETETQAIKDERVSLGFQVLHLVHRSESVCPVVPEPPCGG